MNDNYYKAYDNRYKQVHDKGLLWEYIEPSPVVEDFIKENNATKASKILDLGCGEGRDAINLLKKGYNVFAIDQSSEAIKKCIELSKGKYADRFCEFDIITDTDNSKYNFIYSISVLHMFVLDKHRESFFKFIYNHLEDNGKALITVLGDGKTEKATNIEDAFTLSERILQQTKQRIMVSSTSCRIVNWDILKEEIKKSGLHIEKKFISKAIPGFNSSMCVILKKVIK